jgi:hypothetical protein
VQLDVIVAVETGIDALVVVVDRHRENALGAVLTDDVAIEAVIEFSRGGYPHETLFHTGSGWLLLLDDLAAQLHALIADVDLIGSSDQAPDFFLALIAEGATVMHPPTSCRIHAAALT